MKKIIASTFLLTIFFTNTHAQLGKIKRDRDDAEEKVTAAAADNYEGWTAISNPQQVFDQYIFKVSDYAIEGITDKIQNAIEFNKIEQAFANSTWKFYNDGEVNVTNGNTVEYSFTVSGSTFIINDGKTKSQAQFSSKNSLYKLKLTEGNSKPIHLVLEPIAKKGYDLYSKKELRKYNLTYLATNGDMYLLKQPADYGSNSRYIYTNITPNGMFEQYIHYAKQGSDGELYFSSVPLSAINSNGLELIFRDVYSGIAMPISSSYITKHYTESISEEKKNTNALVFGDFSYDVKGAYTLLKQLVAKLPADKKAVFAKGTAQRDALVEEQYKKERIAWAKVEEEMAKQAAANPPTESGGGSKPAKEKSEVSFKLHNKSKVKVDIEIKAPGRSRQTFINANTMERCTAKIGAVVYVNGGARLTVSAAMEGTTQVIAQ